MILDLRADSAEVIKPVFDAARRTLDTGRVEIGTGSLRIWGAGPANIAAIDITLDPEAFNRFKGEPGEYGTNIQSWWDVIREARKSDPIWIYTKEPEYNDLDAVPSLLTGDIAVLEENGITTVNQLRDAPEDSLVGEVTYEMEVDGELKPRTGEITEGKATRIKRNFDPFVIIEIDGEDPIDSDRPKDYPRLADYDYTPQKPDVAPETFVEVNGSDFSKGMRALSTVTEDAFVTATEGAFILYGEGDTDAVHATPEASVGGPDAGALYSGAYLESLRLSLDRKASTTLKIGLHDVNDPKPLTAEFTIRDGMADVDWYLAPRIRGSDEVDETVPELLERVAPSNYTPLNDVRLDAATTGGTAKAWFKTWNARTDECRLNIDGDGIRMRVVDPANVMLQTFDLPRRVWESYSYKGDKGILQGVVGLAQSRLMDYVKLFRKADELRFQIDDKVQWAIVGEHFTASGPTIDPDSVRREPDLPALELPGRVVVNPDSFTEGVEAADDVSDHVILTLYDGTLYVHAEGDLGETAWTEVTTIEGVGYGNSLFSVEYLDDYMSTHRGSFGDIEIVMGREFPVFLYHKVNGGDFSMMLAPRINKDDTKAGIHGYDHIDEHGLDPNQIKEAEPRFRVNDEENGGEVHMIDEPGDDPLADREPDEEAERVRAEVDASTERVEGTDTYDPTDEFEDGYGPTMDTPIPEAERARLPGTVDQREIVGTALSASDLTDWPSMNRERDDPEKEDVFLEAVAAFYDPTQEEAEQIEENVEAATAAGVYGSNQEADPAEQSERRQFKDKRMENAHYWAAQLLGWMKNGPNDGLRGTYYVTIRAGQPILVMDESWNESNVKAITDGLRDYGFPSPLRVKGPDELTTTNQFRLFVTEPNDDRLVSEPHPDWRAFKPTRDSDEMFTEDQLEWNTPNPAEDHNQPPADDPEEYGGEATPERIQEKFPKLTSKMAELLAEKYAHIDGILTAKPPELMNIKGISDGTVARLTGQRPWRAALTIQEQREQSIDDDSDQDDDSRLDIDGWDHRVTEDGADSFKSGFPAPRYPESEASLVMVEPDGDEYVLVVYPFDGDGEPLGDMLQVREIIETYGSREAARTNAVALAERIRDEAGRGQADEGRSAMMSPHRFSPTEVNGWHKADTPTIEYQNPENTDLAHVEAHADDTFTARVQGDETGDERIGRFETRSEATEALVEWMEANDPEGYGLKEPDGGDESDPLPYPEEIGQWKLKTDENDSATWWNLDGDGPRRVSLRKFPGRPPGEGWDATVIDHDGDEQEELAVREPRDDALVAAIRYMNSNDSPDAYDWYAHLDWTEAVLGGIVHLESRTGPVVELPPEIGVFTLARPADNAVVEYHNGTTLRITEQTSQTQPSQFVTEHADESGRNLLTEPTTINEAFATLVARAEALSGQPRLGEVEVYDPTDEFESDDRPTPKHFGDYRREKVERLENTPRLDPVETFETKDDLAEAIREIHVPGYSNPSEDTLRKLDAVWDDLPSDEARRAYLNDYKLGRTVNSARRHFNEWVDRKKRFDQIPGWAEAGPSNYPKRKFEKRRDSADNARETLDEKLDRLHGRIKGAFRRALKKAGTSEAEINEAKREDTRKSRRDQWKPGDVMIFRDPRLKMGCIYRVNEKSVRISFWSPYHDEITRTTKKLDSSHIQYIPEDEYAEFDPAEDRVKNIEEWPETYRDAQIMHLGAEWVKENTDEQPDNEDFVEQAKAAAPTTLKEQLVARGLNQFTAMHLAETYGDLDAVTAAVEAAADVTDLKGVGEGSAEQVIAAFPEAVRSGPSEPPGTEDVESSAEPDAQSARASTGGGGGTGLNRGARRVLKVAWDRYKRMLSEYHDAREELAEYRDVRDLGAESAAEINEVRRAIGQEPIAFEGTQDIEAVPGVGGELLPNDVGSSFVWQHPYDPTKEK